MSEPRFSPAAAVLDGKIYVTGKLHNCKKVEVYDPKTNTWATTPPMGTSRRYHGMAALGGKIYVAGGEAFSSVEAFDPQTSRWAAVAPMSTARKALSLTAVRGKLYAVGGMGSSDTFLATAEAYDPQQNRWEAVAPMAAPRHNHTAAV